MAKSKSTTQNLFSETVSIPALEHKRRFAIGEANCLECGKRFTVLAGKKQRKQFCSHRCQAIFVCKENSRKRIKPKRAKVLKPLPNCAECGVQLTAFTYYCDICRPIVRERRRIANLKPKITKPCIDCGTLITATGHKKRCDECTINQKRINAKKYRAKRNRTTERRIRKHRHRAKKFGVIYELINPIKVFERDGWRCQVCGVRTPKKLRGTFESNAPELDHRIPMAMGGTHTWDNVQCCCRECNSDKGSTKIRGQMQLFPQALAKSLKRKVKTSRGGTS